MKTYDFVHLALHATGGRMHGKTKLQKVVYFLGLLTGQVEELGYRPHFYGPYSSEVTIAVRSLKALGFVNTTTTAWGTDARGFERVRTDYTLNEDGTLMARRKAAANPELWRALQRGADLLEKAGERDYMKLSIAAKTWFMLHQADSDLSPYDLTDIASNFGWEVTAQQLEEATDFLNSLGLLERSKSA